MYDGKRIIGAAAQKDDPRPPDMLLWGIPVGYHRFQTGTVGGAWVNDDTLAACGRLASGMGTGNPIPR